MKLLKSVKSKIKMTNKQNYKQKMKLNILLKVKK